MEDDRLAELERLETEAEKKTAPKTKRKKKSLEKTVPDQELVIGVPAANQTGQLLPKSKKKRSPKKPKVSALAEDGSTAPSATMTTTAPTSPKPKRSRKNKEPFKMTSRKSGTASSMANMAVQLSGMVRVPREEDEIDAELLLGAQRSTAMPTSSDALITNSNPQQHKIPDQGSVDVVGQEANAQQQPPPPPPASEQVPNMDHRWVMPHPRYWNSVPPCMEDAFAIESQRSSLLQIQLGTFAEELKNDLKVLQQEYRQIRPTLKKKNKKKKKENNKKSAKRKSSLSKDSDQDQEVALDLFGDPIVSDGEQQQQQSESQQQLVEESEAVRFSRQIKAFENYVGSVDRKIQAVTNKIENNAQAMRLLSENHMTLLKNHRSFARNLICHANTQRLFQPNTPGSHLVNNPFVYS